jgi:F-type H+-transporting ATPase subunit epsilon
MRKHEGGARRVEEVPDKGTGTMPLHFELVSPAKLLFSGEVASVQLPGTDGDMTILPGHAPVLSTLRPGVVVIEKDSGPAEKMYVRGGFAEVNAQGLTLLAETAIPLADLKPDVLAQQIKNAEEDVADAGDDEKKRKAAEALDHLKQLQAAM